MKLPRLMIITELSLMRPSFEEALQAALNGGARLIQLRVKSADAEEVLSLARAAQKTCAPACARLFINSHVDVVSRCGAAGVHLPEKASVAHARQALGSEYSIGQSIHSVESAQTAEKQGADYLLFGSVFRTQSHTESTPAGVEALNKLCSAVSVPVFAVGGIEPENARQCLRAGAHGVAVIRSVWNSADVEQAVRTLCESVER